MFGYKKETESLKKRISALEKAVLELSSPKKEPDDSGLKNKTDENNNMTAELIDEWLNGEKK